MANNQIIRLLEFVNMQMAAEAFLIEGSEPSVPQADVSDRLIRGNTHASHFTPVQATLFTDQYQVLAQYRNDPQQINGTGFSGTLFKNRATGELTLSFRSTEFLDDEVRDSKATNDLELKELGWGFGQIAEMEAWYNELRGSTAFLADGNGGVRSFNVTGYSLGAHLATAFNILRREESVATGAPNPIIATYTINGAGTGGLLNGARLTDIIADFNRIRANYTATPEWLALTEGERNNLIASAQFRADAIIADRGYVAGVQGLQNQAFGGSTPPLGVQAFPNYQIAALLIARNTRGAYASNVPTGGGPLGVSSNLVLVEPAIQRFSNMTEIVGMETQGLATSFVSNSGIHYGQRVEIPIEAQPLYRGSVRLEALQASIANFSLKLLVNDPAQNDFGDTHSLVLLVDSLTLMAAMEKLAPTISIESAQQIFAAMSSAAISSGTGPAGQGKAEGDTLERMLDALRKLVLGPGLDPTLDEDKMREVLAGNTWALNRYRIPYQNNLQELREAIDTLVSVDSSAPFTIDNLATISAAQLTAIAGSSEAIAYRYALQELNPFAVLGDASVEALYGWHNLSGELNLYNAADRTGALTSEWITDRSAFLVWKNLAYSRNAPTNKDGLTVQQSNQITEALRYIDLSQKIDLGVVPQGAGAPAVVDVSRAIFGDEGTDNLIGGVNADHLYGGAGTDYLQGKGGSDYLEGGTGQDIYLYNGYASFFNGNGLLSGNDGNDTIRDTDGNGVLRYVWNGNPRPKSTIIADASVKLSANQWSSADGKFTYTKNGTDLIVAVNGDAGGGFTLKDFRDGDFNIRLRDPRANPVPTYTYQGDLGLDTQHGSVGVKGAGRPVVDPIWVSYAPQVRPDGYFDVTYTTLNEAHTDVIRDGNGDPVEFATIAKEATVPDVASGQFPGGYIITGAVIGEGGAATSFSVDYWLLDAAGNIQRDPSAAAPDVIDRPRDTVGNDRFILGGNGDHVYLQGDGKGGGNDWISGGDGRDVLEGGIGNDMLEGGANGAFGLASDSFWGQGYTWWDGSIVTAQTYAVNAIGGDLLIGGAGDDELYADTKLALSADDNLVLSVAITQGASGVGVGGKGDFLTGGAGDDWVVGGAANDYLEGGGGDDIIIGGQGDDNIASDAGTQPTMFEAGINGLPDAFFWNHVREVSGPADAPVYTLREISHNVATSLDNGPAGADVIYAGAGADWVYAGGGDDYIDAGIGDDVVFGDGGSDVLIGDAGNDVLNGDSATDDAAGTSGDDYVDGGDGNDTLFGGNGADVLIGGAGNDSMYGGTGKDIYVYNKGDGVDLIADPDDIDGSVNDQGKNTNQNKSIIVFGDGVDKSQLTFRKGSLMIDMGNGDAVHLALPVGQTDPSLTRAFDHLQFADGSSMNFEDVLAQGFDIDGTEGNDNDEPGQSPALIGTSVTDRIRGFSGDDVIGGLAGDDIIDAGAGDDFIDAGAGNDFVNGGTGADLINGGEGNDTLIGGGGGDAIYGGAGDDAIFAADGDLIVDSEGTNSVDVTAYSSLTVANLEVTQYQGPDNLTYLNMHLRDVNHPSVTPLTGGVSIQGGEAGAIQTITVNDGAGGVATLTLTELMRDYTALPVVYSERDIADTLTGTQYADTMFGGGGADTLQGNAGDDLLDGGTGNDTLIGGLGNDTFLLAYGGGRDTVIESAAFEPNATNTIRLDNGVIVAAVTAVRQGSDLEVRLTTEDALVIADFYLQPENWQQGWQLQDVAGSNVALTSLLTVTPPPPENWLGDKFLAFKTQRANVYAANRTAEGLHAIGSGTYQRIDSQYTSYLTLSTDTAYHTRSLVVNSIMDSTPLTFGTFVASQHTDTTSGGYLNRPIVSGTGGGRTNVASSFGGATNAGPVEFYPSVNSTNSMARGFQGSVIVIHQGDIVTPVYRPQPTSLSLLPRAQAQQPSAFDDQSQWDLTGYNVVRAANAGSNSGGDPRPGLMTAISHTTTEAEQHRVTDLVADTNTTFSVSGAVSVGAGSAAQTGAGNDNIVVRSDGYFFAGPVWQTTLGLTAGNAFIDGSPLISWSVDRFLNAVTPRDGLNSSLGRSPTYVGDRANALGAFVDAGADNDTVTGSSGQDVIAGGSGNDVLDGRGGSDRYLYNVNETGIDQLSDTDSPAKASGYIIRASATNVPGSVDAESYLDWFYWSRGIVNWDERAQFAGKYQAFRGDFRGGPYFDTPEEAADLVAQSGGIVRFIDPLPVIAPVVTRNDTALLEQLMNAGVISRDVVEFGPGLSLNDLDLTMTVNASDAAAHPEQPWYAGGTLSVRWGDGGFNVDVPSVNYGFVGADLTLNQSIYHLGDGVEEFQFADGARYTLEQVLQHATIVNRAPVLANAIADQPASEDTAFSYTLPGDTFTDPDVGDTLAFAATLNDGSALPVWLNFDAATRSFSGIPGNGDVGAVMVKVTATDLAGAAVFDTFDISVANTNDAPVLATAIADQAANEDADFRYTVAASTFADVDVGDMLSYSAIQGNGAPLPTWLTFNAATRSFSGTPANGDVGAITVKVTATDVAGAAIANEFDITVANTNDAPAVANAIADQAATEDAAFSFTFAASTFEDVDTGDSLAYAATLANGSLLPSWLSFDAATRTFSGTPFNADVGTALVRVTATDIAGAVAADTFDITVANTNDAPTVANLIADQSASEDSLFNFTLAANTFNDVDVGDTLTYSATRADGTALPSWLTFNSATRSFSGTPLNAHVGTVSTKVSATDAAGAAVTDTFDITIANTNDAPTVANAIADQTAAASAFFSFTVPVSTFADVDVGDTLSYSATRADGSALPSWLSFNAATRIFSGMPGAFDAGTLQVKVIATDSSSANVFDTFNIVVISSGQTLTGTAGNDSLTGGLNNDLLTGLSGNDTLNGGAGADTLIGGTGNDTYVVDNTGDVVTENPGEGIDTVQAGVTYTLGANVENLVLTGAAAINGAGNTSNNVITGNSGNNVLDGGAGADTMIGGIGNDTYVVDVTGDTVIETANQGTDTVQASITYTLGTNVENLTLTGITAINGSGNAVNNVITGNAADNTLDGGAGADTMIGGLGNDTYVVDNAGDVASENPNAGADTVLASVNYSLGDSVENLVLTGAALNGAGNALNNVIVGNAADNVLSGGAGADTLAGGQGNDTYVVDVASDTVLEFANQGTDTVQASITYTLGANVENLTLTGAVASNGTGNTLNNVIIGNSADNVLNGGTGADTMMGGLGNDTYFIDGADSVVESAAGGEDLVYSTVTHTLAANVEHLVLTGTAALNGAGNALNNLLRGNAGINTLAGGAGNDMLEGGAGNDTLSDTGGTNYLNGQDGVDTLIGNSGNEIFIGGSGNDSITTGTGADIIAFNRGDGSDIVAASNAQDNTISLGGGIRYADLFFQKSGKNLILKTAGKASSEGLSFTNWYSAPANHSVLDLQVVVQASADFDANSTDPTRNKKVAEYNFGALVNQFDAALAANPALTTWALTNALASFHLSGSDSRAVGGDLAYQYGLFGNLASVGTLGAQNVLGDVQFGSGVQALQTSPVMQSGIARLS